ncbi:hypothetical protein ES677_13125 [Bizionia gelidisalsuginis]|uniref:Uncharacterized protein n=2 Tax=Bizionia TaxID=283785 RepID=A0A8H2QE27_9FLAO|nr:MULTISPECIES: hypothetical protein [Bizionia]TYB69532.1 hypothetical protein ES676_13645 [Bizionia saleffrena]TYC09224.1 hypothetical protein ES677_13125 [Bizionia gelidisalsuginis]
MKIKTFIFPLLFISLYSFSQVKDSTKMTSRTVESTYSKEYLLKNKIFKERISKDKFFIKFSKKDTLYILLEENKNSVVNKFIVKKDTVITYIYILKDSSKIEFQHMKYFDFDKRDAGITSNVYKKHKKFLKDNKNHIINNCFFRGYNKDDVSYFLALLDEILTSAKKILIIDKGEFEGELITIREVELNRFSHKYFMTKI